LDVHSHLGDCGGDETDVSQGQVGEKEVHGCLEVRIKNDSQGDKQVPNYGDQVHGQEQSKDDGL
jgi:hypothetical protein